MGNSVEFKYPIDLAVMILLAEAVISPIIELNTSRMNRRGNGNYQNEDGGISKLCK